MSATMRLLLLILSFLVLAPAAQAADAAFDAWLRSLWPEAQRLGISRKVFDEATRGLEPDLTLPDLVVPGRPDKPPPGQAEFVQTPADYLNEKSLARLTEHGRTLAAAHRETLARIEKEFGVPGPVVLAIWGRETDFGRYKLPHNALRVLATQGYLGRRKDYFRQEFLVAIKMVEDGLARPAEMKSSWGGAMGLTQFLPSEFYKHAVDFDGDGRADIFNSVPDALASAAKQLAAKGWQRGERWAYEVRAPSQFRLHARRAGGRQADARMAAARFRAVLRSEIDGGRIIQGRVRAAAGRRARSCVPDAEKLLRDQGI